MSAVTGCKLAKLGWNDIETPEHFFQYFRHFYHISDIHWILKMPYVFYNLEVYMKTYFLYCFIKKWLHILVYHFNWAIGGQFQGNIDQNATIFSQENILIISSAKWWPSCLGLDVLIVHCIVCCKRCACSIRNTFEAETKWQIFHRRYFQLNASARISKYLNPNSRRAIHHSFIASNFSYCPLVWHFCGKTDNAKLERIQ